MSRPIDRHTVDQLVVEHLPVALRLAQRLAKYADTSEEIVQEALCRVLDRWKTYRGEASFEQIVGIEGVAALIGNITASEMRTALIRRLLTAGSDAALAGYLSLVRPQLLGHYNSARVWWAHVIHY